jgi:hypothetical protein
MYILFKGTMGDASVPTPLHTTPAPTRPGTQAPGFPVELLQGFVSACSVCLTTVTVSLKISRNDTLKRPWIETIDVYPL